MASVEVQLHLECCMHNIIVLLFSFESIGQAFDWAPWVCNIIMFNFYVWQQSQTASYIYDTTKNITYENLVFIYNTVYTQHNYTLLDSQLYFKTTGFKFGQK